MQWRNLKGKNLTINDISQPTYLLRARDSANAGVKILDPCTIRVKT